MKFLSALLCVFGLMADAQATGLPQSVKQALRQAHIPLNSVGIVVHEVNARKALIGINATQVMNPASTMKLLTTLAGLEMLGPAYKWKTEAWLEGKLDEGVLQGDLILKGYGDPKFTIEQFWLWLRELRARGLREIRGDLVLDRSLFDLPPHDPAAFDHDPLRAYNVGPDALLLNFNALRLRYLPDGPGMKIISEPALEGVKLDNQLVSQRGPNCDNWDDNIRLQKSGDTVMLQGSYPSECGEREQNLSIMPHTRYVEAVFRALWQELGGDLHGNSRDGVKGGNAQLFATHYSAPLAEVIRDINKFSNNVMARQLFLTLGLTDGAPASTNASNQAVRAWLKQLNLSNEGLVLENGAGLSREERISAQTLSALLLSAYRSPLMPEFVASLPILGVDGTMKKRLHDKPAASHAHLKTGTLEGVKTVAGYIKSRSGREWVMVFFINHANAAGGNRAQDALIEWVQQRY
jgi:serine-type D-Ala-D-Ala carboxypeptidase/endopeptidase (penicillin-binding protein 4)